MHGKHHAVCDCDAPGVPASTARVRVRARARQILALLAIGAAVPASAQETAFTNAHIVNPKQRQIIDGVIIVRDGRIAGIHETLPPGFTGQRVDLGGRWVIPGLVDMHTHSFGNTGPNNSFQFLGPLATARADLYVGVIA